MLLTQEFHQIIQRVGGTVAVPKIEEVLLPPLDRAECKQDEFGFVLLDDGSVGPFYISLDNSRASLSAWVLEGSCRKKDPIELALKLGDRKLSASALALGVVNAVTQHLMRRAGFDPSAAKVEKELSEPTGSIGVVGYFGPVIERYLARGYRVTVVEKKPERVPTGLGVEVSTDPSVLESCDYIICTASTLINDTLQEILDAVSQDSIVNLMGPSASCFPDPLFASGVDLVGGILIDDPECLKYALRSGESWGRCGRKYQLSASCYPGLDGLLASIERS